MAREGLIEAIKSNDPNTTWQQRAEMCIGQGTLTNSKHPDCFVRGVYPTHVVRAKGIELWTAGGGRYIDFVCGLGSSFLGYGFERINIVVQDQLTFYGSYSLASTLEVQVAERIKEMFPVIEKLKFLKTGSEACSASIKIARAATGRKLILSDGYHGMGDEFVSLNKGAKDVGSHYDILPLLGNEPRIKEAAAVIIEPCITEWNSERIVWLKGLREECSKHGTILIYDEVITGLRFKKHSVARCSGVLPDLIILGKAIGNGYPISVVGGRADLMDNPDYFVSTTYAGDTVSLSACLTVLNYVDKECNIDELWAHGEHFWSQFNKLTKGIVEFKGYPTRGSIVGDDLKKAVFFQEMCLANIIFGPSPFFSFGHIPKMDLVLSAIQDVCMKMKCSNVELKGAMPKKAIAQKMREK